MSRIEPSVELSPEEAAEQLAREQRRKKVEKLFRVLGVHVPAEMINAAQERINSSRDYASQRPSNSGQSLPNVVTVTIDESEMSTMLPMSASEKRAGVRRAEKLERMFGARPPQDLVVHANPTPMSRNSISADSGVVQLDTSMATTNANTTNAVISSSLASQAPSLLDLLDMEDNEQLSPTMNDSYQQHQQHQHHQQNNGSLTPLPLDGASLISLLLEDDTTVDSLLEYVSSTEASYEDPNTPEAIYDKGIRQRRLRKLKRFFGHELEAGQLSP
ncbi:hypothetical protein BDF22DRAFT_698051 [Syncephalis plumigaleata]|nr:hypothetical protein BDF22DRAFT_698051 [Syncephalis plumigaleata]